jgi:hypothetical protein
MSWCDLTPWSLHRQPKFWKLPRNNGKGASSLPAIRYRSMILGLEGTSTVEQESVCKQTVTTSSNGFLALHSNDDDPELRCLARSHGLPSGSSAGLLARSIPRSHGLSDHNLDLTYCWRAATSAGSLSLQAPEEQRP